MIKKGIFVLSHLKLSRIVLGWMIDGYLHDVGWTKSMLANSCVDADGRPVPWLTYPMIDFLSERLTKEMSLLEFGCGNSTIYFSGRTKNVLSIEHNESWLTKVRNQAPKTNVQFIFAEKELAQDYTAVLKSDKKFDIVLIDGILREECLREVENSLTPVGVVILDDSERDEYKGEIQRLLRSGFKEIKFWGFAPLIRYRKSSSLFYRTTNCFQI